MNTTTTDRIEKEIFIKAPRQRVWRALTDAGEFGEWFRVKLTGQQFASGKSIAGPVLHPGYEHLTWSVTVEKIEPERVFSWRWCPHAIDPNRDYSKEPTTLVTFELEERPGGTLLKVTESGFDQVPIERRETAYRGNSQGWAIQMGNIERYVSQSP
jgi:uncharacterized protein YndB with AHSA1/START domain